MDQCSEEGFYWVLPWKGRGRGSVCWVLPWKGNGALKKVSLGLAMERKRQRIDLLGWIGLLSLAVERKSQRIGLLCLVVERELSSRGARRGGAGRKVMAEYS